MAVVTINRVQVRGVFALEYLRALVTEFVVFLVCLGGACVSVSFVRAVKIFMGEYESGAGECSRVALMLPLQDVYRNRVYSMPDSISTPEAESHGDPTLLLLDSYFRAGREIDYGCVTWPNRFVIAMASGQHGDISVYLAVCICAFAVSISHAVSTAFISASLLWWATSHSVKKVQQK